MKIMKVLVMCFAVVLFTNGCIVSKKVHEDLLSEKAELDIQIQKLKMELSDKDKELIEQKNRITTLRQENMELQTKYKEDMKVAEERQEELREKYERYKKKVNEKIEELKTGYRVKPPSSDQKETMEDLYHQLEKQLQEGIEKGQIKLELHRKKIE